MLNTKVTVKVGLELLSKNLIRMMRMMSQPPSRLKSMSLRVISKRGILLQIGRGSAMMSTGNR